MLFSRLSLSSSQRLTLFVFVVIAAFIPGRVQACTFTSKVNPSVTIRFNVLKGSAFVRGSVYERNASIGVLGSWICSSGGTCGFFGGTLGEGQIIGFRDGRPTSGTGKKPNSYLFSGLSLGSKWNSRIRAVEGGLWTRGKQCNQRWYDFP